MQTLVCLRKLRLPSRASREIFANPLISCPLFTFLATSIIIPQYFSGFMNSSKTELWVRFQKYYTEYPTLGLSLDLSRMNFGDDFFATMKTPIQKAFIA